MAITVKQVEGLELYCRYGGQGERQPCYVELDCEAGELSASYNAEIGGGVPFAVWHNLRLRWPIPALRAEAANELFARLAPIAERIVAGYSSEWDGHNHVGRYTDDADEARQEAEAICERAGDDEGERIESWDAADWLAGIGGRDAQRRDLKIDAATTDENLEVIAERLQSEADAPAIIEGLGRYLRDLRDDAIAEVE